MCFCHRRAKTQSTDRYPSMQKEVIFHKTGFSYDVKSDSEVWGSELWGMPAYRPSSMQWRKGNLNVSETWSRLAMDINSMVLNLVTVVAARHCKHYLIVRISILWVIPTPVKIHTDNDRAYYNQCFRQFFDKSGISLQPWCIYAPSENDIVERCHCTVKRTAARNQCPIMETKEAHPRLSPDQGEGVITKKITKSYLKKEKSRFDRL